MTPNFLQVIASLALVLVLIVLVSWSLSKLRMHGSKFGQLIHLRSSVSVGTRERLVLVEVSGQWVLLGVTPSQITTLLKLDHAPSGGQSPESPEAQTAATSWLSQYLKKNHAA